MFVNSGIEHELFSKGGVTFFEALARCRSTTCRTASGTSCWPRAARRTSPADVGEFDGRVALVTGGSSGIGAATVALPASVAAVASFDLEAGGADGVLTSRAT